MTEQPMPATPPAAAPPAPPAPAPNAGTPAAAAPATPAPATGSEPDWKAVAEKALADVEQWKGHSRGWEAKAKAKADQADTVAKVAQALGIETAAPTPEQIAQQLAAAQQSSVQLARENSVLRAAVTAGADPNALLDSRSFLDSIGSIDPTDSAAVEAAVKAAVAANPRYAAATAAAPPPAPPVRQASAAGQFGQPAGNNQWTADDVKRATPEAISKAMREGRLESYLNS